MSSNLTILNRTSFYILSHCDMLHYKSISFDVQSYSILIISSIKSDLLQRNKS